MSTKAFSVSVIVPVLHEAESLKLTVDEIFRQDQGKLHEVLIVVCRRTTRQVHEMIETLKRRHGLRLGVVEQRLPWLGGALRAGIEASAGTHVLTMFSDLESDPSYVGQMITLASENPEAVISASRWLPGGGFDRYGPVKLKLNRFFQKFFAQLFTTHVTDFTYGYRLYPKSFLSSVKITETGHRFVLEMILRAIMSQTQIIEFPTRWQRRIEGRSQITIFAYLRYWSLGLKLWLLSKIK